MIPQFYLWIHTPPKLKESLKEIFVHLCSVQSYSQEPKGKSNPWPSTQERMNKMWYVHTRFYSGLKRKF